MAHHRIDELRRHGDPDMPKRLSNGCNLIEFDPAIFVPTPISRTASWRCDRR
jgi:hypothetical protein